MTPTKRKAAKWIGYYQYRFTTAEIERLKTEPPFKPADFFDLADAAAPLGYTVSIRSFGYKLEYVAELYGKYESCPNAGYKLTAEGRTPESAMMALLLKLETLGLDAAWPELVDDGEHDWL
jgi:hypothetical protein